MCGIFGAVSSSEIQHSLINGLSKLEYRGYDSAGISLITGSQKIKRVRCVGKVKNLNKILNASKSSGHCGIAHTRWATHGKPILKNSHPHNSSKVSIVDNGIIENSEELKSFLKKKRYKFTSDTDSEVIAHLFSYFAKNAANSIQAMKEVTKKLKGSFAIAAICERWPEQLLAACNGSPLLIGTKKGSNFISSDIHALSDNTNTYVPLLDNEIVELSNNCLLYTSDAADE